MAKKNKQKSVIVFDISDYSIEVIEASLKDGVVLVVNKNRTIFEHGLVKQGVVKNLERVTEIIDKSLTAAKIVDAKSKSIILVLPSSQLFYQLLDVKKSDPAKRKELIREKLVETIPIDKEEINFVYKEAALAKVTIFRKNKENLKKYFTVSFRKSFVQSWRQVFEKLNLPLEYFELDLSAHYFSLNLKEEFDTNCVIDFGSKNTNVFFLQKGRLKYAYTFFWGGEDLTRIIAKSLDIGFLKAEKLKKEKGLTDPYKMGENKNLLYPILEEFLDDLKVNISFYEENYISIVRKIILIGGGSNLKGLKSYLFNRKFTNCKIERSSALKNKGLDSVYQNAYGAAFSFFNKKHKNSFYIPADSSKDIKKDFLEDYNFVDYIKNNISNIKSINFSIPQEKKQFYVVLFIIVIIFAVFSLLLFLKGKSDQTFLSSQVKLQETQKSLLENGAVKEEKKEPQKEKEEYIKIKNLSTSLRIRSGAGKTFSVIGKTESEKVHKLLDKKDTWLKIEFGDKQKGWVSKAFVDFVD